MKKVLSLILCLTLVCGLFAMSAIGVSAEGASRVLNDFDTIGSYSHSATNYSGNGWQTKHDGTKGGVVDYTTIDASYTGGKVYLLNAGGANNYGGFVVDTSWTEGNPVAISFDVWAAEEGLVLGTSRTGLGEGKTDQTPYAITTLGYSSAITLTATPQTVTYDLSNVTYTGNALTLIFGPDKAGDFYVDNIKLTYAEGQAAPETIKSWEAAYDWEDAAQVNSIVKTGGDHTITRGTAYANASIGSTNGLRIQGKYANYSSPSVVKYISIPATEEMKAALSIKMSYLCVDADRANCFLGITVNGVNYWKTIPRSDSYGTYIFDYQTYYTDPKDTSTDSITLTRAEIKNVESINFSIRNDYSNRYIDDIMIGTSATAKATFPGTDIADIPVDGNNKVTLPAATSTNFVGWLAGDVLYKAGKTVSLSKTTSFTALTMDVALQTGAGIRWAETEQERGIRFETYVTKATLDTLGSSKFELGALILPYADYNASITVDTASSYGAVNVVDPKVYGEAGDNYRYYTGIVDFEKYFAVSQSALADLKLTAVSYVKVTYEDGTASYIYDHPDATDNVRTVAEVARAALADTEFGYNEQQIAILNLYTQYSEETSVPSYRKEASDNLNAIEEVEFAQSAWTNVAATGTSTKTESHDNGTAINDYTPTGSVQHLVISSFAVGNTLTFTLPETVANGIYKISFNTRGFSSRASAKIEVSSDAGDFVAGDSVSFAVQASGGIWHNVAASTAVTVKGTTTIKLTSTAAGSMYLYDIVLTPAK